MNEIYIVTTNDRKFNDYKMRFKGIAELKQLKYELNEGRDIDIKEITKSKLNQAKKILPNKKIIVDDRGFLIKSLNNFPGPFVKLLLNNLGVDNLTLMMENQEDREARFLSVIGYFDGKEDSFFEDNEIGFITKNKREGNLRGWTDLMTVYGYKLYPDKALCELSDNEWDNYINVLSEQDAWKLLIDYIKKENV